MKNAREEVLQMALGNRSLGNINMNAPEEYTEVNERYEFMRRQVDDLIASRDKDPLGDRRDGRGHDPAV